MVTSQIATPQIQEDVELAPFTSLGIGGPARFFARVRSEGELEGAVAFAGKHHLPLFALGGGSNLLVRDEGFPGLVIHLDIQGESRITTSDHRVRYDVPAGVSWDQFVLSTCENNLTGVECLAGIPGLTGGTPVQNVGAYGQEVSQTIQDVRAFDRHSHSFVSLSNKECDFAYRSSRFNAAARGRFLVTQVSFGFERDMSPTLAYAELQRRFRGEAPSPLAIYHAVREIRLGKGMLLLPGDPNSRSAGSFFKNPVVPAAQLNTIASTMKLELYNIPHWAAPAGDVQRQPHLKLAAAWLVEQAGFAKGFVDGRVGISSRHSLALINRGGATYADLAHLRDLIRLEVNDRFGIHLEQEPVELNADAFGRS